MAAITQIRQAVSANLSCIKSRMDVSLYWLSEGTSYAEHPAGLFDRALAVSVEYDECMHLRGQQLRLEDFELRALLKRVQTLLKTVSEVEREVMNWLQDGLPH